MKDINTCLSKLPKDLKSREVLWQVSGGGGLNQLNFELISSISLMAGIP